MKQDHIIGKVLVEISVGNKEKAYQIKDDINSFLTSDVFPKLEKYIDALQDELPGHTIQIPHLSLSLDTSVDSLNDSLKDSIAERFEKELAATIRPALEAKKRFLAWNPENQFAALNPANQSAVSNIENQSSASDTANQSAASDAEKKFAAANAESQSAAPNPGSQSSPSGPGSQSPALNPGNHFSASNPGNQASAPNPGNRPDAYDPENQSSASNPGNRPAASNPGNPASAPKSGNRPAASDAENDPQISLFTGEDRLLRVFIHFLEKGSMPWWNSSGNTANILETKVFEKIISAGSFGNKMAPLLQRPNVRERIINQLTDKQINQLCIAVLKNKSLSLSPKADAIKQLSTLTLTDRKVVWLLILNVLKEFLIYPHSGNGNAYNSNNSPGNADNKSNGNGANNSNGIARSIGGSNGSHLEEYALQQIMKAFPLLTTTQSNSLKAQIRKEIIRIFPFIEQNQALAALEDNSSKKNSEEITKTPLFAGQDQAHAASGKISSEKIPENPREEAAGIFPVSGQNQRVTAPENASSKVTSLEKSSLEKSSLEKSSSEKTSLEKISPQTTSSEKTSSEKPWKEDRQSRQKDSFSPREDSHADQYDAPGQDSGHYVQNAGLILIHPFLRTFFKHCGLIDTETQKFTNPELSVHLLHYIATGKTSQPESEMLFEKFLCNIPLQQSISRHVRLSRKHKSEAKNLIETVLENWSSMKNSLPQLLQNEFFQRPGKLVFNDDNYTITVERKTQDILMEKISWGVGLVKLPWQDKFIHVNW